MGRLIEDYVLLSRGIGIKSGVSLMLPRVLNKFGIRYPESVVVDKFIKENFQDVLGKYTRVEVNISEPIKKVIWCFWWQGVNNMPPTITVCYNQLLRNANGREVILLSENNYKDYVNLPPKILEKFDSGIIGFSHFSDIIRVTLLKEYGGLWIDAAIFATKPIEIPKLSFYTPILSIEPKDTPHLNLWVIGCMAAAPKHPFFSYLYDLLVEYWSKFNVAYTYLFFDYFIRYGYEHFSWIKKMISECPLESPDFFCRYLFKEEVDYERLEHILANNNFISLTYRVDYPRVSKRGKETYYSALLKKYNYPIV